MAGEKTEKATPKRREDERKKGNIFQSREITIAFSLLIMFVSLKLLSGYMYKLMLQTMAFFLSSAGETKFLTGDSITKLTIFVLGRIIVLVLPLLLISALSSFIFSGIQTKFNFSTKQIALKLDRLNPISGFKKMVSVKSLIKLIKSLLTIVILGLVIYFNILDFSKKLVSFYAMPIAQAIFYLASSIFDIFIKVCFTVLAVGVVEYFIEWWQHEKDIKMSKQEIKDEYKLSEGDPQVKAQIKDKQQKMSNMRMMKRVPEADIVIVNPVHFAVALKYDDTKNKAPLVIAKGKDNMALKIKEIAAQNDIKIEENPPLARALYQAVEVDMEIPPEFYQAVAEILSYVFSIKRKKR